MASAEFKQELEKTFIIAKNMKWKSILAGDFNSKSVLWGSNTTDTKGDILQNLATDCEFECLNNGDPTFIINDIRTHPDVTFGNHNTTNIDWRILPFKITKSNHQPILIELNNYFKLKHENSKKVLNKKLY